MEWALSKSKQKNKCWYGCKEIGTLVHCLCSCKMVQLLWKTFWWLLKKLNVELQCVFVLTRTRACTHLLNHFSRVQLFVTLRTIVHQACLSLGFSRQEYWNGLPCSPPGDLPNPGLPHCRQILYHLSHQRSPRKPEWVACPFRGSSLPRDRTGFSCIAGGFLTS